MCVFVYEQFTVGVCVLLCFYAGICELYSGITECHSFCSKICVSVHVYVCVYGSGVFVYCILYTVY